MSNDLERLEQQVEAEWSAIRMNLCVEPSEAVVDRIRMAVRGELNEAWLRGRAQPVPGDDLLRRVAAGVRRELTCVAAERARESRLRRRLAGGVAVAATIALVFGVTHFGRPARVGPMPAAGADVIELFAQAADEVWSADPLTREMDAELEAIEETMTGRPAEGELEFDFLQDGEVGRDSPARAGMVTG